MLTYFFKCGIYGWPLLIMSLVIAGLIVRSVLKLAASDKPLDAAFESSLNAIVYWGVIAAVTGFLGQYHGIYNGLSAVIRATEIDPHIVAAGFAESFTTTLWGLILFVVSAMVWLGLGTWYRRVRKVAAAA